MSSQFYGVTRLTPCFPQYKTVEPLRTFRRSVTAVVAVAAATPRLRPRAGRGRGAAASCGMLEAAEAVAEAAAEAAAEAVAEAVAEGEGAAAVVERGTL